MATHTNPLGKQEMLYELENMLVDVLQATKEGQSHHKLARAHGYIDGYMRVMLDTHIATRGELLKLVSEVRSRVDGPALHELKADDCFDIA